MESNLLNEKGKKVINPDRKVDSLCPYCGVGCQLTYNIKDEKIVSEMAKKDAKQALTQKILETESNSKLIDNLADKFNLNFNVNLIEVYDNSHVQGSDAVGALITFGKEGFVKKRYRKFNIKSDAVKGDDYGMMKEVLNRRFVRAL